MTKVWTAAWSVVQHQQCLATVLAKSQLYNTIPANSPFILVPSGSPFFPISAHALSPKVTWTPSFRCTPLAVRNIIACLMSPLFTLFTEAAEVLPGPVSPMERDFCTTTTIRSPWARQSPAVAVHCRYPSPILPCRFIRKFFMHSTIVAPELSIQLSIVF